MPMWPPWRLAGDTDALHSRRQPGPQRLAKAPAATTAPPYTSTIVLVVARRATRKASRTGTTSIRPDIKVITPNPKTSGGARWNYLAAWEFAKRKYGSDAKAKEFVTKLYANVPVLDTGARGSSVTFAQRGQGDVFISGKTRPTCWKKSSATRSDFVYPSLSHPGRTRRDRGRQKRGQKRHTGGGRGVPGVPLHRRRRRT